MLSSKAPLRLSIVRRFISINRPSPPPLPPKEQKEFDDLRRQAETPLTATDINVHPDARSPLKPEFEGDTNPKTGEKGGPKQEPVGRWGKDAEDWSFKGRVSDF